MAATDPVRDVDDIVRRWTNTKLGWSKEPTLYRPGSVRLSDQTDQMNIATAEILGVFGVNDPMWWESLAELCNLARAQIQKPAKDR